MPRQFRPLPGVQVRRHSRAADRSRRSCNCCNLAARLRVLPFQRLQTRNLLLDLFQFLLRLQSRIHFDDVPIPSRMMRFHDREHEVGAGNCGVLTRFPPHFCTAVWSSARFVFARLIDRVSVRLHLPGSTDDAHTAAPAQLFHAAQKIAVRHHIIAFGFHHHHEIAVPLHVEQHLRLALALIKQRVQRIDRAIASRFPEESECAAPSARARARHPAE